MYKYSLIPRPEKRGEGWFQPFAHALNCGTVSDTIDILPYTHDAYVDTKRYTVRRFIIAAYGLQRNSLNCIHPAADLKL